MKRVLVLHSWGMGDLIVATPMIKSLALSGYLVDLVLFSKVSVDLVKNSDFINEIFLVKSKFELLKFYKKYDYLISTAGTNPKKIKLLNLFIKAKKVFAKSQERDIHRIDMNIEIASPILTKVDKKPYIFIEEDKTILKKYLKKDVKNIGFAVGGTKGQKFKRWGKFKELIDRFEKANKLIFIGEDELELEDEFKNSDAMIVKESIKDVIYLISKLDLLVGNDNGLMHIGYATGIDTVTIFGMTNHKESGGYNKNNKSVFLDIFCRPCFDPSTDRIGCKGLECLKELKVDEVLKVCKQSL